MQELQQRIEHIQKSGIVPGLEMIRTLCEKLGNPQNTFRSLHIAGTNGKGSVGFFLRKMLSANGYRVGHFSSPAVENPMEIIQVDGIPISESDYKIVVSEVLDCAEQNDLHPTAFEMQTAACYLYFQKIHVDFAVIECGLGGREDATNILEKSEVCILTAISLDHTNFLGNTVEAITENKCGIIHKGCQVVVSPNSETVTKIVQRVCTEQQADFYTVDKTAIRMVSQDISQQTFYWKEYPLICLHLLGTHQPENVATAVTALECLQRNGVTLDIPKGLVSIADEKFFGRCTIYNGKPTILFDGGHNMAAVGALVENVKTYFSNQTIACIVGAFRDKEFRKTAQPLLQGAKCVCTVPAIGPRAYTAGELQQQLLEIREDVFPCRTYEMAYHMALAQNTDLIICFGSFSWLSEMREVMEHTLPRIKAVLENKIFQQELQKIEQYEENRIFCGHHIDHLVTVADVCMQMCEEYQIDMSKEMIYTTALMHDIGRAMEYEKAINHEIAGVELAREILPQCGYTQEEIDRVTETIGNHRAKSGQITNFRDVFSMADKLSRNCATCSAYEQCNWDTAMKQHTMEYIGV